VLTFTVENSKSLVQKAIYEQKAGLKQFDLYDINPSLHERCIRVRLWSGHVLGIVLYFLQGIVSVKDEISPCESLSWQAYP